MRTIPAEPLLPWSRGPSTGDAAREINLTGNATPMWPLVVYAACVAGLVALILLLSHFLGQRHRGRAAAEPYESGILSAGTPPLRVTARFYLLAMLFVVFDLEVAFLVAWAVVARDLGWAGYGAAALFTAVLGLALAYLWRSGALEWGKR